MLVKNITRYHKVLEKTTSEMIEEFLTQEQLKTSSLIAEELNKKKLLVAKMKGQVADKVADALSIKTRKMIAEIHDQTKIKIK